MRLFVHSSKAVKAVKAGHPADPSFITVNEGPLFLAWKTTITGEGIVHPNYRTRSTSLGRVAAKDVRKEFSERF